YDLTGVSALLDISPVQACQLAHTKACAVEQSDYRAVAWMGLEGQHSLYAGFVEDALSEAVLEPRPLQGGAAVEPCIPELRCEGEQALDAGNYASLGRFGPRQGIGEGLEIRECDDCQRLHGERLKLGDIVAVGAYRMFTALRAEPQPDEILIAIRLA